MGKIITFYSYRGGAGRTTAIVNVAHLLVAQGHKVLIVDMDLETPSMHYFMGDKTKSGFMDLIYQFKSLIREFDDEQEFDSKFEELRTCKEYIQTISNNIDFMSAGEMTPVYACNVTSFDWNDFYKTWHGYGFINAISEKWRELYDYVLVDTTYGMSTISGICTLQLPDIVLFFYNMSTQSVEGVKSISKSVCDKSNGYNRSGIPKVHYIGSNIDTCIPHMKYAWEMKVVEMLKELIPNDDQLTYVQKYQVPYLSSYTYGDAIAVKSPITDDVASAYHKIVNDLVLEAHKV